MKNFETVYYLKALPGGWIFRKAPEDWQVNIFSGVHVAARAQHNITGKIQDLEDLDGDIQRA